MTSRSRYSCPSMRPPRSARSTLQLQGSINGIEANDLSYVWSSTCLTDVQLADPASIASEPDTAFLVIREDTPCLLGRHAISP